MTTPGFFELYPDAAPKTVANFLDYVKAKHYDGTQFHRVIAGFMIQGGGFTPDFMQKPTKPPIAIESEQSSKAGLVNVPGLPIFTVWRLLFICWLKYSGEATSISFCCASISFSRNEAPVTLNLSSGMGVI